MTDEDKGIENRRASPALRQMVEKLDARPEGHAGYIASLPELEAILKELSPKVSVGVFEKSAATSGRSRVDSISIEIKVSFSVSRSELGMR